MTDQQAFDAGHFRGEGSEQQLTPGGAHARGLAAITTSIPSRFEQALAYFLFGALQQFYFDGNQRTARFMMNGHLMSHGVDAISVPARRVREFNSRMVDFYRGRDATGMVAFLTDCHPDAEQLMSPALRAVLDG
jgi:hypothetical protein